MNKDTFLNKEHSNIEKALFATGEIFRESNKYPILYRDQNIAFSIYGLFHRRYSIPYFQEKINNKSRTENDFKSFIEYCKKRHETKKQNILSKSTLKHSLPFLISIITIFITKIAKKNVVAIWSGDYVDSATKSDFRVGDLNEELYKNQIEIIELIRMTNQGLLYLIKNGIKRKRPVIYYESLCYFFNRLNPKVEIRSTNTNVDVAYQILNYDLNIIYQSIPTMCWLFKFLRVTELISWEYSERQAALVHAAKSLGIYTIGFMHGAGMKAYMAHEFISECSIKGSIGPDIYGVWSEWWKEYYLRNSKIYGKVEVSGTLRKKNSRITIQNSKNIRSILVISEPLAEVNEIIPYIDKLLNNGYRLSIKIRPTNHDIFYKKLMEIRPDLKKIDVLEGNIFEAIKLNDMVIGSHSTAVIDASSLNVPFCLLNTSKWGDYFEIYEEFNGVLFANNEYELVQKIEQWKDLDVAAICNKINKRFYGDDQKNGCKWVANQVILNRK